MSAEVTFPFAPYAHLGIVQNTPPLNYSQNPPLDFSHLSFLFRHARVEESVQAPVQIASAKPFRSGVCVLLVGIATITREAMTPQGWINLSYHRLAWRNLPTVEWPKMHAIPCLHAEEAQPRDPSMGRFRD